LKNPWYTVYIKSNNASRKLETGNWKMQMYVLVGHYDYECDTILGVYSSPHAGYLAQIDYIQRVLRDVDTGTYAMADYDRYSLRPLTLDAMVVETPFLPC
jgi:hypothetical protein